MTDSEKLIFYFAAVGAARIAGAVLMGILSAVAVGFMIETIAEMGMTP